MGIRRHTFKLPAYGPQQQGTLVKFFLLVEKCTMKKLTINIETANVNCKYIYKIGKKRQFYKNKSYLS
jgi:hypothetical protein